MSATTTGLFFIATSPGQQFTRVLVVTKWARAQPKLHHSRWRTARPPARGPGWPAAVSQTSLLRIGGRGGGRRPNGSILPETA
jgi:hypothetical protein